MRRPAGLLVRAGLWLAGGLAAALPARPAYALADLMGRLWYRRATARRRLVAANLARVLAASGAPPDEAALDRLVRHLFVGHARYYLEILRFGRYRSRPVDEVVTVDHPAAIEAVLRAGATVGVSAHFGNYDPGAIWMASRGLRWVAPVERVEPPELFEFLRSRRGGGNLGGEVVALPRVRQRLIAELRDGHVVAIIGDRDLDGSGQEVSFFGHPARIPVGPATLAVLTGASVVVGTVRRVARDRFAVRTDHLPWTPSGDRSADVVALTGRIADALAAHIAEAPDQWWGASQPIWPDLTLESVNA